ncbi:hypothetical protein GPECTOR_40g542 [Gonium pectorale]|uniref:ubiquitinyl hydrolase 1 n=1 Tax=Gonium pectorale TaxID=33097 RepID=A0A150GAF9_GONPE|nr:hypothetical protein GPECTOR_40g542 [Gonium pectorale]|eukprot:KXZ46808.1 hypothetical protein GPECTOR_40g542 [Gonium pectorale]
MCLKHTLNNIFQREAYTSIDLDRVADGLTPPSALGLSIHRTPILGAYDINILELALQQHGKPPRLAPLRWLAAAAGGLGIGSGGRHWLGLRPLDGVWYNLDSHLDAPQPLGDAAAVCAFVRQAVCLRDAKVLLVTQ